MKNNCYTQDYWNAKWEKIFNHYQLDLRHAYYIRAILKSFEQKILEIGAGSFRDAIALNRWGLTCHAIDYSEKAIELVHAYVPEYQNLFSCQNAFHLNFTDSFFDFSYSNGVIGCFSLEEAHQMLQEQARVTKYRMAVTVHNKHNQQFFNYFQIKSKEDKLYKVNFFSVDEITELMSCTCNHITIIPVGKMKKYYEDDLINIGLGEPDYLRKSFNWHRLNLLNESERLLCIGEC